MKIVNLESVHLEIFEGISHRLSAANGYEHEAAKAVWMGVRRRVVILTNTVKWGLMRLKWVL